MAVELTPKGTRGPKAPRMMRLMNRPFFTRISRLLQRRGGSRLLLLTTVGAKSGREHTVTLFYFPDGKDSWLVVGSVAGAAQHPAWYFNMAKNPDKVWIEVEGRKLKVQPESLRGTEREEAWKRIVSAAPNYGGYQKKTDREIPVVRLRPAASPD